jgi:dienelactone hydrolase
MNSWPDAARCSRLRNAEALAHRGIAGLCIDAWNFGERRGRTESELFKELLWRGHVLWGLMVYDTLRANDYVLSRSDVRPDRVATLGMSMGSTMAWWLRHWTSASGYVSTCAV